MYGYLGASATHSQAWSYHMYVGGTSMSQHKTVGVHDLKHFFLLHIYVKPSPLQVQFILPVVTNAIFTSKDKKNVKIKYQNAI